jgi:hypothetical protein
MGSKIRRENFDIILVSTIMTCALKVLPPNLKSILRCYGNHLKKNSVKNAFRVLIRQFWKILNRILGTHFKISLL